VSDRSAAGCWLGFTAGCWLGFTAGCWLGFTAGSDLLLARIYCTSVFQILEQVSTIFILADSCCCCWLHYEILEGPSLCPGRDRYRRVSRVACGVWQSPAGSQGEIDDVGRSAGGELAML
jgi:hypothetical protein